MERIVDLLKKFKNYEQLVLLLSRESLSDEMVSLAKDLVGTDDLDWDKFTGISINERVNGVIYKNICKYKIEQIPNSVCLAFRLMYLSQAERNKAHQIEINSLSEGIEQSGINHAFLKGAVLNTLYYEEGERISNDTDIMVLSGDISGISKLLNEMGYMQGSNDGDKILPATKKEIVFKRMNTYEIVPFFKETYNEFLPFHEVDINFKLSNDEKTGKSDLLLDETEIVEHMGNRIRTMSIENFLLFLCNHLYREAVMIYKIVGGNDLSLYKFMDIHFYILKLRDKLDFEKLYNMAEKIDRIKDVYYAFFFTEKLYPGTIDEEILKRFQTQDNSYLEQYRGRDNTDEIYYWQMPFEQRIFDTSRKSEAMKNIATESERFNAIMSELKN